MQSRGGAELRFWSLWLQSLWLVGSIHQSSGERRLVVAATWAILLQSSLWRALLEQSVLLCLGCSNRIPLEWVVSTADIYFSQFWKPGSPRSRHWQIGCLVRAHFLSIDSLSGWVLTSQKGWGSSLRSFIISFMRAPPWWPPKGPPANTISFQHMNFFFFIFLFMAVLGLRFCTRAFSNCGEQGPLFIAVRGPLIVAASLLAEHRLQTRRLSSCGSRA